MLKDNKFPEQKYIGKVLCNKYKIQSKISEGTFGCCYLALNIENNKLYAIKI
jgi:hypothetical protein